MQAYPQEADDDIKELQRKDLRRAGGRWPPLLHASMPAPSLRAQVAAQAAQHQPALAPLPSRGPRAAPGNAWPRCCAWARSASCGAPWAACAGVWRPSVASPLRLAGCRTPTPTWWGGFYSRRLHMRPRCFPALLRGTLDTLSTCHPPRSRSLRRSRRCPRRLRGCCRVWAAGGAARTTRSSASDTRVARGAQTGGALCAAIASILRSA